MQGGDTAKQIARWVAQGALFLIPFMPLMVADTFFFPFITGKAFYFRILVEVAVCAWAVLAFLDKEYRPRLSWIGIAVIGFVAWMFIADAFALNAAKAFWSNFERMEGWVMLVHLLGFFFAASAVLRAEKKWRAWFLTSILVAVILSGYALLQLAGNLAIHQGSVRIDATLGNSAYLAIYFLFTVCVALWLALTEKYTWLKWSLIALAVLDAVLILFTETRGTALGLIGAYVLASVLFILTAGKRIRNIAIVQFLSILLIGGSIFVFRTPLILYSETHPALQPVASALQRISSISIADGSTRFTIWGMALQGVAEKPVLGWGQEGFNYVFNKYYVPSLYEQEPWFDRAHNAFIDWLTAGGVPAFLLYLSLFGTAIVMLWRSSELSRPERTLLTAALVGYAVHNLFVFDNLYSYVYFFALLALIDSQVARPIEKLQSAPVMNDEDGTTYALPLAAVVAGVLIWTVNVSGMQTASKLITALTPSTNGVGANLAAFQDLAAHPSFAAQEVREQLVNFASNVVQSSAATDAEKQSAVTLALSEMHKQVAAYPRDAREHLQLSYVYRTIGDSDNALKEIQLASALSPKKEAIWTEMGVVSWDKGDVKAAQTDFNTAFALGPTFPDLAAYAAAGAYAVGDTAGAEKILTATYGTTVVDSNVLAVAYYRTKDWPRLIALGKLRVASPGASVQTWFSLAAAEYAAGDRAAAVKTINEAVARFPDAAASAKAAIEQINAQ